MTQSPEAPPPPEPGGKLKLSRTAKAILVGLALAEVAVILAFGLPRWGGLANAAAGRGGGGSSGSRAAGEHQARQGPGAKAEAKAETKEAESDKDADSGKDDEKDQAGEDGKVSKDPEKLEALKKKLSDEQMNVCFLKGTEPPFSGKYYHLKDPGEYRCAVCGQPLFESAAKFDSGTGWPSFWDMAFPGAVSEVEDNSHGMQRIEVTCSSCGSHLGHVFPDGPEPSGLRYCINSLSLEFIPAEQLAKEKAQKEKAAAGSEGEGGEH